MIIAQRTRLHALENQQASLKQQLSGVKWQLESLKNFSSKEQLKVWRKHRSNLNRRLNQVKQDIAQLMKRINGPS
jgi:chromosome segregation ATPase